MLPEQRDQEAQEACHVRVDQAHRAMPVIRRLAPTLSSAADALAPVGPFRPNDGVSTKPGRLQVGNPVRFDAFYGPADRAARDASADSLVRSGQKKGFSGRVQ